MAGRKNKYESHVKPYFKEIKEAFDKGTEEKEIAKSLGIAQSTWFDYKLRYKEFSELLKRDEDKTKEILKKLDSALLRSAYGYDYEEKKVYKKKDTDGKEYTYTEITTKHQAENITAIFGAYNRFDPSYIKDKAYYDLKVQELEIRKIQADKENF